MLFNHKETESPEFSTITIFTTALCNLNCSYCYICKDKNGGLQKIDEDIKECFDKQLYIKQILDLNPKCHDTITDISLWGGEPFLKIYRFINHIQDFFKNFPNLKRIDVSSNFTLSDHPQRIQDLVNAVQENLYLLNNDFSNNNKFIIDLQISIDGYEEMNDITRGKNTTKKIFENWQKILNNINFDSNKIEIHFFTKTTLSKDSWHFVNTPEKAYKWCKSFENNLYDPWNNSNKKVNYMHGLWNNAMPAEYTKNDGIAYAKVTQSFFDIQDQVMQDFPGFQEQCSLIPEAIRPIDRIIEQKSFNNFQKMLSCKRCGMGCGVFSYNLVPIPHGKFTMCHRGLFDEYAEYADILSQKESLNGLAELWSSIDAKKHWIFNKEQILQMHNTMNKIYEYGNQIFYTDLIQQLKYYADSEIIDSKYQNIEEIKPTLGIFLTQSQCIQDCFIFGGSWTTRTPLEIPLLYNGSMDIIIKEINQKIKQLEANKYEKI